MKTLNHSAVYVEATQIDIHDLVRTLVDSLGAPQVQVLSGTTDRTAPHRWAHPEGAQLDTVTEQRLRLGYRVWLTLQSLDDPRAAVEWLQTANPLLDDARPLEFIAQMHAQQVVNAAESAVTRTDKR